LATVTPVASLRGLTKVYGGVRVLAGVDLDLVPGEVHALLGANGAGKSTLIKCLSGAARPTSGELTIGAHRYGALTPRQALEAGVAVIYQHFSLVGSLSTTDNVFLGSELRRRGGVVRRAEQELLTAELFERLGVTISPRDRVGALPVAQQQLVEIAKAIHRRARLLILDEPTASLSAAESRTLLEHVRRLRAEGLAILYVTHLLDEVFEVGDRVTVLRDGKVSLAAPTDEVTTPDLIRAISGSAASAPDNRPTVPGAVTLAVRDLQGEGLGPISFDVRRGEVVGIFGLLGSGRTELLETIFGIRRRAAGEMELAGRRFAPRRPTDAIERGLALVPAERLRQSIFATLSTADNVLMARMRGLGRFGIRRQAAERRSYEETARELQIRAPGPRASARTLSGGNQQKVAVGRWLGRSGGAAVIMLDEPTQGIDVGARAELYRVLRRLAADDGRAVLFTSSSPEEVVALADRAAVLHDGRILAVLPREELRADLLLTLAHQSEAA
jgi:ribose transport system ATP-binding protein